MLLLLLVLMISTLTLCACSPPSARGRRRLDFKRFLGKAMFLDLPGYRHAQRLEEELTARGAVSEGKREGEREGGCVWSQNGERASEELQQKKIIFDCGGVRCMYNCTIHGPCDVTDDVTGDVVMSLWELLLLCDVTAVPSSADS